MQIQILFKSRLKHVQIKNSKLPKHVNEVSVHDPEFLCIRKDFHH